MFHFKVALLLLLSGRLGHSTLLFDGGIPIGTTAAPTYANACDDALQLSELEKRSRDFTLALGHSKVEDIRLFKTWYTVSDRNGQYKMPDSSVSITLHGCGTVNQIYINGVHPEVLTEEKQYAELCVQTNSSQSEPFDVVAIRNCSGELQYFLRPTNRDEAYCFDPPEVQGIKDFSEAPTNFFPGVVTVAPKLQWTVEDNINIPNHSFECLFQQAKGLMYRVKWSVDGEIKFTKGPAETLEELRLTTHDLTAEGFYLGIVLQCSAQASVDKNGLFTPSSTSNEFFAGIQITNPSVILNETMPSISISFYSTFPIGCVHSVHSASCEPMRLHVQMKNPDTTCSSDLAFQRCSKGIRLLAKNDSVMSEPYDFKVTTNFKFSEPKHLQLFLETDESYTDEFFAGQSLQTVSVSVAHTNLWKRSHCYSHVDPHMKTFFGTYYENQISEDYVLYKNTKYGIEVQERTKPCNKKKAQCTCQVAVRAGADVFIINRCPGTLWLNEFRTCTDGGILDVVKINEHKFKIYTPIGTVVEITTGLLEGGSFMNVDIFSSPKDVQNVEGLCGYYDINISNDLKMSNGLWAINNTNHVFSNSWRVEHVGKRLLTGYTLNPGELENWASVNSLMCVCKQSPEFLTGAAKPNVDEGECDQLDDVACTYSASITSKKCRKIVFNSKRSLSRHPFNVFDEDVFLKPKYRETLTRRRRQSADADPPTEEVVRGHCSNIIRNAPSITQFPERLMGENIDEVIEQCVFDVMAADGDISVGEIHAQSLSDLVKQTFSYEPTFVANNRNMIKSFLKETCPNNCSGRGVCSEDGECICATLYHGPECNLYERDPINVALIEGGGVCDTALGDDCLCHWFYTKNLLESFTCKFRRFKVVANSTKLYMDESVVPGYYDDMFTGQCCLPETRNKRSIASDELGYEWELALSNDGLHFGTGLTLYTIDQTCLDVVTNSSTNERRLILKGGYCLINFQCVADTVTLVSGQCRQTCSVHVDQFGWSNACETNKEIPITSIVAIAVGTAVGAAAVVCVSIWICCKLNNKKRLVGIERVTGLENTKPVFPNKGNYNFQKHANAELPEWQVRSYETPRDAFYRRDLFEVTADQSGENVHCTTTNVIPSRPGSASGISFVLRANPTDFD